MIEASPCEQRERRPSVFVRTFGCQMNEYDSQKILGMLAADYQPTSTADAADLIIVNTCSVREKAENKVYSLLGGFLPLKKKKPGLIIGVAGCVAQQEGEKLLRRVPFVSFVVGTHNLSLIPALIKLAKQGAPPQAAVDYREEWEELPEAPASERHHIQQFAGTEARALISIQRGCDKHCSYCVVPRTRGPQLSRASSEIEREIRAKVALGAREVLLLGQTVNSYGKDMPDGMSFEQLVRKVACIEGVSRIRFTSPHPADVSSAFISLYEEIPALCPHIHLPLQSGSDRVLALMNRSYTSADYLHVVERLRARCPGLAVTTDLIVGFPTETEEDFQETLRVMREVRFHSSFSFKYSPRPGTAALAFSPVQHVPPDAARRRLTELQELQERISGEINSKQVGHTVQVLVEGDNKTISSLRGRIPENTTVEVIGAAAKIGELIDVLVERSSPHCLRGRMISAVQV